MKYDLKYKTAIANIMKDILLLRQPGIAKHSLARVPSEATGIILSPPNHTNSIKSF
jgi:hypothetical protein